MKSGKQRRAEIREERLRKARRFGPPDRTHCDLTRPPPGSVMADPAQLAHNNTYGALPLYYVDRAFTCRSCGAEDLWTAKQQKWWYEIAKGNINTTAKYCRACRQERRVRVDEARRVHVEGLIAKHGIDVAAERLSCKIEDLQAMITRRP